MLPSLARLAALIAARSHPDAGVAVRAIAADTRELVPGSVFVALRGPRCDGHDFVPAAFARGACAAVVEHAFAAQAAPDLAPRLLPVADTERAYQLLAGEWRRAHRARVVAVTGSVGKTSTKELLRAALATAGATLATPGNQNHERGVPAALLRLADHHRFAVLELGMRGPGEIAVLAACARPDVALITNAGEAHLGRLGSRAAIARAKCELVAELAPHGTAILPADDPALVALARSLWAGRILTFGVGAGDVCGMVSGARTLTVEGLSFSLPLRGAHQAMNFVAMLAVARALDVPWPPLARLALELPAGRGREHRHVSGARLWDESYNAAPASMLALLDALAAEPARRRIAVLGSMRELGPESAALHRAVGARVAERAIDRLFVLDDGPDAAELAAAAAPVPAHMAESHASLAAALSPELAEGDLVLFKAARAVALERVLAALELEAPPAHEPP